MKIAVYHNLGAGGGKRALYEYVKRLKEKHYIDLYILSEESEKFTDIRSFAKHVYSFDFIDNPKYPLFIRYYFIEKIQKKVALKIDEGDYDLVFLGHCVLSKAPFILKYLKTPSIYYCQEPYRDFYEVSLFKSNLNIVNNSKKYSVRSVKQILNVLLKAYNDRNNANHATEILSNSYYSNESIYKAFGRYSTVAYLGVDSDVFKLNKSIKKTENSVLSIGAMDPKKGHEFVVKALSLIDKSHRPILNIVYYSSLPEYEKYLKALAENLKVEVNYYKNISYDKVIEIYNKSKITLCAQELEPFGLTPLESMSCGTPVIGVKEAGIREIIIDNENGLLVNRDESQMADAVKYLLENDDLYEQLRIKGLEYIKKWDWDKQTEHLENIFGKYIKNE